ncbi:hypothetical protein [Sinorhizobium fredii]|uniref:hypothetical protein n=1 Tax=Rhizobium fredii TaxID=380 RepID=UPI003398063E
MTKVVLPAIRKDGGYIHGKEHVVSERDAAGAMTEDELVFKAMEVMKRKVDRLHKISSKSVTVPLVQLSRHRKYFHCNKRVDLMVVM